MIGLTYQRRKNIKMAKDYTLLKKAIQIAEQYHREQTRHEGIPYIVHPMDVLNILIALGVTDETLLCAAVLHDTIEDTEYTEVMMRRDFGDAITNIVLEVTKIEENQHTTTIKEKMDFLKDCVNKSFDSLLLKFADRYSNVISYGRDKRKWYQGYYAAQAYPMVNHLLNYVKEHGDTAITNKLFTTIVKELDEIVFMQYEVSLLEESDKYQLEHIVMNREKGNKE